MPHLMRFTSAAFITCCALALGSPAVRAQSPSPDESANAPATRANSPDDAAIADRISAALKAEPSHFYRHVTVSVTNGVARLGGMVYSTDAIEHAKEIARNTPGVRSVQNQMQLERQGSNPPGD